MPTSAIEVTSPVISPDGRRLAFVLISGGKRLLYVRPLDSLEGQPLSGTDDAAYPFWSPDSRYLAFFSNNKLKKIDASGGAPQTLCDAQAGYGGTWNTDGVILISLDVKGIQRVSASGGVPTPVLQLDTSSKEISQAWPTFLPDGKHFLYQSWSGRSDLSGIFVAALDGSNRKLIMTADSSPLYSPPGYILVARGSTLIAQSFDIRKLEVHGEPFPVAEQIGWTSSNSYSNASVSEDGVLVFLGSGVSRRQLVWFDRGGKELETLGAPGLINDIVLSRDGKRLAVQSLVDGNTDIWLIDVARGVSSRFTFDKTTEDNPVWSPDGKQIVFSSGQAGADVVLNLYQKISSGAGNAEVVLASDFAKEATDWSSDGRFILFQTYPTNARSDVWVLPLFGDRKPYPLLQTEFEEGAGRFSSDGHWFAYTSNETGRNEVYVQSFPQSGGKWLVSNGGGGQPHWRRDGKELFYIAPDRTLMSVEVNAGATFEAATPKPLFATQVSAFNAPNRYVVAADGQRFLVNSAAPDAGTSPITVILNWNSGLKQ